MGALATIDRGLLRQRGHLFPWLPVFFASGIGAYFYLRFEPDWRAYAAAALVAMLLTLTALRWPGSWGALAWAGCFAAAGFGVAGLRAHDVGGPVLSWRYYGPVEGRIVAIDRSASDALRITLDQVRLARVPPHRTPDRIRLSLHGDGVGFTALPGHRVMTTAHLSPPQGPVEPGGFDFQRHAWFLGLGAVGYTRVPVVTVSRANAGRAGVRVTALRMAVSNHIRSVLPGEIGGFAAAVSTGDRSGVGQDTLEALRDSNLAHLLAISGLHMGLLAGFVFGALRLIIAAAPALALRLPGKKLAAIGALAVAAVYLALSGGNVATERAFVMVAVLFGAVLVDRRAFSLRAVAFAALIVLALRPESLISPGFQMSFAATTALVAVFGWMRDRQIRLGPSWAQGAVAVVISSAVAGAATGPYGAAHFNVLAHYGLPANLAAVPVMGALVIPAAVLAACLAPLGLDWIGLTLMGWGLEWILGVAEAVSGLPGARGFVHGPGPGVLPLMSLGFLLLILWQGRLRFAGLLPVVAAFALWTGADRPAVLIADTGNLVGVMTPQGRALSKPRGAGFIARVWLENDGDGVEQMQAAARWPVQSKGIRSFDLGAVKLVHITGKRAAESFADCTQGKLVVSPVRLDLEGSCEVFDVERLQHTGSLALGPGGLTTARSQSGQRLWNSKPDQ